MTFTVKECASLTNEISTQWEKYIKETVRTGKRGGIGICWVARKEVIGFTWKFLEGNLEWKE